MNEPKTDKPSKPQPPKPEAPKGLKVKLFPVAGPVKDAVLTPEGLLHYTRNGRRCVASIASPIVKFVEICE